jgi:uncharacterized surface protein with fasciclin (FAS1) repeats
MTIDSTPFGDRLAELDERARLGDISWLRDRFNDGEFGWLEPRLGPVEYSAFGSAIKAGELGLVRNRLAAIGDSSAVVDAPKSTITTFQPPASAVRTEVGDPLSSHPDDPTLLVSRHGAVLPSAAVNRERNTLIVIAMALIVAAGAVAFLLLRDNDDADAVNTETSVATASTADPASLAPPVAIVSETPSSSQPADISTSAATASTTIPLPLSPLPAATAAPGITTPLADVISTAARSSTFGAYLEMIGAAGLTNEIKSMKNVTFLAPTESAFAAVPVELQTALRSPANQVVLKRIVRYSVLTQSRSAAQFTPGDYETVEGSSVNIQLVNGSVRINDATVTGGDVNVTNGVFHAIDRLLVPATVNLNALIPRSAATAPSVTSPATTLALQTTVVVQTTVAPATTVATPPTTSPPPTTVPPGSSAATTAVATTPAKNTTIV